MAKFCPKCGAKTEESWKVCASCGAPLTSSDTPHTSSSPEQTPPSAPTPPQTSPAPTPPDSSPPEPPKKKRSKWKWLLILLIIFAVGAVLVVALGLGGILLFLSGDGTEDTGLVCETPYIVSGDDCCLDQDDNTVCDNLEATGSSSQESPTTTASSAAAPTTTLTQTSPKTTTSASATETSTAATTSPATSTTPASSPETQLKTACVNQYGVKSDTLLYLYSSSCRGCDTIHNYLSTVASRGGYEYESLNVGDLDTNERNILGCHYSPSDSIGVPQIICPASGDTIAFSRTVGALKKIESFAATCRNDAQS